MNIVIHIEVGGQREWGRLRGARRGGESRRGLRLKK